MGEEKRLLITKIKRTDNDRADLFGKGHRFRDTILFDLSDLAIVGIDYNDLPIGKEIPCRFWAIVTESDKLNKQGNPYLDVVTLEPCEEVVQRNGADLNGDAILAELQAIRSLLETLVLRTDAKLPVAATATIAARPEPPEPLEPTKAIPQPAPMPEPAPAPAFEPAIRGRPAPDDSDKMEPSPATEEQARRMFGVLAGPAIRGGKVAAEQVNELTKEAKIKGWRDAYRQLEALVSAA